MSYWEPFTERARRALVLAQDEAQKLGNNYVGTEHLLLGLLSEGESVAAGALETAGLTLARVRQEVENITGRTDATPQREMVFTPRAKQALESARSHAEERGDDYVGTEHILLGFLSDREGVSARVFVNLGVNEEKLRENIDTRIGGPLSATELLARKIELLAARVLRGDITARNINTELKQVAINLRGHKCKRARKKTA